MMEPAIDGFILDQQRRGLNRTTITKRGRVLWRLRSTLPDNELLKATTEQIQTWLDGLHLAPRARYVYVSHLHAFYDFCVREGFIDEDPTARIRRPKLPRSVPRPMSERDLRHALYQAPPEIKAMLALAAFEGFRCAEIAALQREDILEHEEPPLIVVVAGKGARDRVLPLNRYVERALRQHGLPKSGPVFRSERGGSYAANTITHKIGDYLRSVGISATPHQARHFFGSRMYRETNDLRLVQELLGHSSPSTTAIYAQWNPAKAADVVRNLDVDRTSRVGVSERAAEHGGKR